MTRIFDENDYMLTNALHIDQSFDIIRRPVRLGGRDAAFYLIDGFVKCVGFHIIEILCFVE